MLPLMNMQCHKLRHKLRQSTLELDVIIADIRGVSGISPSLSLNKPIFLLSIVNRLMEF